MKGEYVFYDLETTSAEPEKCRIVQMCFANFDEILLSTLVDPETMIGAEASKIHGITKDKLRSERPFLHYAGQVQEIIDGKTLVGFNNIHFDSVVLDRELVRVGFPGLEKDDGIISHPEIDLFAVWKNAERHDLSTAVERFAKAQHDLAHDAAADVLVLSGVMQGMIEQFELADMDDLQTLSRPPGAVDRGGKFICREDGVVVFNFGKHFGEPVRGNPNYLLWMLSADFPAEVKAYCRRFLNER